ncbi:MAG: ABC transporter permease [Deltaproteobacteria bacterium]|nr:ABC transporter permease [Deltaproteobacteria bacterium]
MSYISFVGWRYLRSRKSSSIAQITAIAVLGVAIGVATLLVIVAISSGFLSTFRDKVLGVNAHVIVLKSSASFPEYKEVMRMAESMDEVKAAAPFIINEMMIVNGSAISGILLKGVDPHLITRVLELPRYFVEGGLEGLRLPDAEPARARDLGTLPAPTIEDDDGTDTGNIVDDVLDEDEEEDGEEAFDEILKKEEAEPARQEGPLPGIVIGQSLAENLGASMGDVVRIVSPVAGLDTSFWAPGVDASRSLDFEVKGIFYSGFDEYDSRLVYVDLYEAQKFYRHGDSVTGVEMRVHDIDTARDVAIDLERRLGGGLYRTIDWEELNHNLFTALKVQKLALTVVLLLSVLMAALNIISTLIMLVLDKRKEISILKSIGASRMGVMGIFMLTGTVIGLSGLALGMGMGYGVCHLLIAYGWPLDPQVYLIDKLPLEINWLDYVMTAVVTMVICTLFTIVPSLHASFYRPVDGLKHE